jgi:dTDP-4-amino-4,6-dideoxygalactose transaminase
MEVMNGPILVHGPKAEQFEHDFAAWTGAPKAVSVSSCTAAMHLAYFSWGFGPGDEVIVPAQTHTATAHAVELTGAKPVFVDAERKTGNIDISAIEAALTERTRAIAVVHFLGVPVDMDAINAIAHRRGLKVLEDCALAIGTRYKGVHAGLLSDAGCFSFYPVKHMTTAEGGMLLTHDGVFAAKLSRQKAFGVDRHMGERKIPGMYDVVMLGYNYRMNEIEAAIGIEQIKRLDFILEKREQNYRTLRSKLQQIDEITLLDEPHAGSVSSRYCLSVLLKDSLVKRRYEIVTELNRRGVGTSVYYPKPVPKMTYYAEKYGVRADAFPNATWISESSIALPVGPHLGEEDMNYVGKIIEQVLGDFK